MHAGIIALTSLRFYLDNAEQQPEQPDITRALRGCSAASSMNVLGRTLYRDGEAMPIRLVLARRLTDETLRRDRLLLHYPWCVSAITTLRTTIAHFCECAAGVTITNVSVMLFGPVSGPDGHRCTGSTDTFSHVMPVTKEGLTLATQMYVRSRVSPYPSPSFECPSMAD